MQKNCQMVAASWYAAIAWGPLPRRIFVKNAIEKFCYWTRGIRPAGSTILRPSWDPTSWFNHLKTKPSNVIHWRNVLPGEPFLRTPESRHMDTFYFCGFNMANVFRWLGGPWGMRDGAINLMPSACDHHDVGENID